MKNPFIRLNLSDFMRRHLVCLSMFISLGAAFAEDLPKSPEQTLVAIRAGMAQLSEAERAITSYRCETQIRVQGTVKGKTVHEFSNSASRVTRSGGKLALHMEKNNSGRSTRARVTEVKCILNNDYMFAITRSGPDAPWTLTRFIRKNRELEFWQAIGVKRWVFHPLTALGTSLEIDELVNNPTFRITTVKAKTDRLFDSGFSVNSVGQTDTSIEGVLTMSPHLGCVVTGGSEEYNVNGVKTHGQFVRVLSEPEQPLRCKSLQLQYGDPKSPQPSQLHQITFSEMSNEPVPEQEFTLGYYGISEPTDVDALPIPFYRGWIFWAVVGIGCLVLTGVFRWLANSRSA
jgi:hypothetical protein